MALLVPADLAPIASRWGELSRWERAELGRALRRQGWSYGEIVAVIPVPKGTLAGWCRGIRLTPDQAEAIRLRTGSRKGVPRDTQRKRRLEVAQIRVEAQEQVPTLIAQSLWVAGTALYWAEGSKSQRQLELTNGDSRVLQVFMRWVEAYHRRDPDYVLAINLHHGNDVADAKRHWEDALGLCGADWHRPFIKPPGTGHRKNKQLFGVCRVRLRRSADDWIRTMAWIGCLAERLG